MSLTHDGLLSADEALLSRRSIRAFLPEPVPRETIERILEVASRAPSGSNVQPWRVHVLTGAAREGLIQAIEEAIQDPAVSERKGEYTYYPKTWVSPYLERRRKVGWDLYDLLGLTRDNKAGMARQHARNYRFFDAPVGFIFTIDRLFSQGGWLDYGMFIQGIATAARARGYDTCVQAAFVPFYDVIGRYLQLPPEQMLVCGMALGKADPDAVENSLVTERSPVSEFARFL